MGEGSVNTAHGELPVPAFATMRLLIGMKICQGPGKYVTGELVTPTAAALLRVLTGVADWEAKKLKNRNSETEPLHQDIIQKIHVERKMGRCPNMTPCAVGIGAGTREFDHHPNVLRLVLGVDVMWSDKGGWDPMVHVPSEEHPEDTTELLI